MISKPNVSFGGQEISFQELWRVGLEEKVDHHPHGRRRFRGLVILYSFLGDSEIYRGRPAPH